MAPQPPHQIQRLLQWHGRFIAIDDLWSMSASQIKASVVMDRLAEDDGRVPYSPERIAQIAGVSRPRVSEAVGELVKRGLMEQRVHGTQEPGYRFREDADRYPYVHTVRLHKLANQGEQQ